MADYTKKKKLSNLIFEKLPFFFPFNLFSDSILRKFKEIVHNYAQTHASCEL